jgi:hypothetical protein
MRRATGSSSARAGIGAALIALSRAPVRPASARAIARCLELQGRPERWRRKTGIPPAGILVIIRGRIRVSPMREAMKARTRQVIAATLIAGGAWAFVLIVKLVGVLGEQWPIAVASGQQGVIYGNGAILVGFVGLASAALIGGILLWRNKNSGRRLAKVVLAAQVLFVSVPHFQYKMALIWNDPSSSNQHSRVGCCSSSFPVGYEPGDDGPSAS